MAHMDLAQAECGLHRRPLADVQGALVSVQRSEPAVSWLVLKRSSAPERDRLGQHGHPVVSAETEPVGV